MPTTTYGDIYKPNNELKVTGIDEVRRLAGNPREEKITDEIIESALYGASAEVERLTGKENVTHSIDDVDLWNLMGKAASYFAAYEIMIPNNDTEINRRDLLILFKEMIKSIQEFESTEDPVIDTTEPSISSSYSTTNIGQGGEGIFTVTNFAGGKGFVRKSGIDNVGFGSSGL